MNQHKYKHKYMTANICGTKQAVTLPDQALLLICRSVCMEAQWKNVAIDLEKLTLRSKSTTIKIEPASK